MSTPFKFLTQNDHAWQGKSNSVRASDYGRRSRGRMITVLHSGSQCLKWFKKKEAGSLPSRNPRSSAPPQNFFKIYFWSENGEFWCIIGGIWCDLELQESKYETRYRPGKSKGLRPWRPVPTVSPASSRMWSTWFLLSLNRLVAQSSVNHRAYLRISDHTLAR